VSHNVHNEQELLDLLSSNNWREGVSGIDEILEDFFTFNSIAMDSVRKAVEELSSCLDTTANNKALRSFLFKLKLQNLKKIIRGDDSRSRLTKNKLQDMNERQIRHKFQLMTDTLPGTLKTKLKVHDGDLFEIHSL